MDSEGFSSAELQPMQLSDIYSFIDHWHRAIREELHDDIEKSDLEPLAEHLKKDIKQNRSLRNIATNPLLCAMLCALNRDRRQQLPADRIELYEACCSLLLERRDKARGIFLTDYPAHNLSYRQSSLLLEDLAYWMVRNGWTEADLHLVDERIERKLSNMSSIPQNISGSSLRRLFVERAGIIREPVVGQIDFTHRTFQEFLAAKAASDEMDIGMLVINAHDDHWREIIILVSGLANKPMRDELIKRLIDRGDTEVKHKTQLHLLAVACLETSIELGQDVKIEVEKRLSQLVPPKDMTEARDLALAGDLAVPYLMIDKQYSGSMAEICIQTLALIGSDAALEALEGYTHDPDARVSEELYKAWDSFERETYALNILSKVWRDRKELVVSKLPSLIGFQYFTSLMSLRLENCVYIEDLSPLASLKQLTSLTLSGNQRIKDISPLAKQEQLISLDLKYSTQIQDISPLTNMKQLISLDLEGCEKIENLHSLTDLTDLTFLNLAECKRVFDLRSLAGLTRLTSLNLKGCEQIEDLTPLRGLVQLKSINLVNCGKVQDLHPLESITQLSSLYLTGCKQVWDLSPLRGMKLLTSLYLSGCNQVQDLYPLLDLTQMEMLDLTGCRLLQDLSPLKNMINLKTLNLVACGRIRDLNSLGGLKRLTSLKLSDCRQIRDLSPLAGMTQLKLLDIRGCFLVRDLSPLLHLKNLQILWLGHLSDQIRIPQSLSQRVKIN